MSQLILINGNPGVGKSTLLKNLKDIYTDSVFFSKDDYKEQVLDRIIPDSIPNKSNIAGQLAMQFGFLLAQKMCTHKHQVFFEANFHPKFALEDLKQLTTTQIKQILLHCTDETSFKRFQSRLNNNSRHSIHTQSDSLILSVDHYIERLKKEAIPGLPTLRVSTEKPLNIPEILDFIDN